MTHIYPKNDNSVRIKVIGVGGGGGNAISNMIEANFQGIDFITANTDAQALCRSGASVKIQLGLKLTEGLGAGANPEVGREAALETTEAIRASLENSHMVFIAAGFGGGTGTGATPVIAEICKELGILSVAVVTKPFSFEGARRRKVAEMGIEALRRAADTVITIPNDRLRGLASKHARMVDMFRKADEILLHSVRGITDLITIPGIVNLDFADVRTTMAKGGMAIMGIGASSGVSRATEAAERAISHPLLEDASIQGARSVLINIATSSEVTMEEVAQASERIYSEIGDDAEIIWGTVHDESLGDEFRVTVIATGIDAGAEPGRRGIRTPKSAGLPGGPRPVARQPVGYDTPIDTAINYEEPTFVRRNSDMPASVFAERLHPEIFRDILTADGTDLEELEVPTFMRRRPDWQLNH